MPTKNIDNRTKELVKQSPWQARIRSKGRNIYLGAFPTWEQAKAVEDKYRVENGLKPYDASRIAETIR